MIACVHVGSLFAVLVLFGIVLAVGYGLSRLDSDRS